MENYLRRLILMHYLRVLAALCVFASVEVFANPTCDAIEAKLSSIRDGECRRYPWVVDAKTQEGRHLQYYDLPATKAPAQATKVLLVGGIHGDEFSSVTISYKWLHLLQEQLNRHFNWRFIPVSNPDGLLAKPGVRYNANGIDLNRNFPTENWVVDAANYWKKTRKDKRRYPGPSAASEEETQWLMAQIAGFNPDVIIAIHAPYHLLDFDGPPLKPTRLGELNLRQLGIYPGSLGNYGSLCLGKQVVTLELASAGVMPSDEEMQTMWRDLLRWLYNNEQYQREKGKSRAYVLSPSCGA